MLGYIVNLGSNPYGVLTMQYWLMKTEPSVFGIDDLMNCKNRVDHWDGIRNYQARNMMRDEMKKGDGILLYHSNCKETGVVGLAKVCRNAYPDFTAWDTTSKYFDPKSSPENPRWVMVDVKFVKKFSRTICLTELREQTALQDMTLLRKGNRLSIMPVTEIQWQYIVGMEAVGVD